MRKFKKQYIIALIFTLIGAVVCQNLYALRVPIDRRVYEKIDKLNGSYIPNIIIVVGCSGSGKNTLIDPIAAKYPEKVVLPKLTTTRGPRHGESSDGYRILLDEATFKQKDDDGSLTMVRDRHGHWYGLDKTELERSLKQEGILLFDTSSTESLELIKDEFPQAKVLLVLPRSFGEIEKLSDVEIKDILRDRIDKRSKLTQKELDKRLEEGVFFLRNSRQVRYDQIIINDSFDKIDSNFGIVEEFVIGSLASMGTVGEIITQRFSEQDNISFADLDTGTGEFVTNFTNLLKQYFKNADGVGVELFQYLVDEARANGHNVVHGTADVKEDYPEVGLSDNSRDIVTINNIESRPWALIEQADRIVKENGLIMITFEKYDIQQTNIVKTLEEDLKKRGYNTSRIAFPEDYPHSVKFEEADFILIAWKGKIDTLDSLNQYKNINDITGSSL